MDDKLTIVGPEPSGRERTAPARVNIEALLLMAKYDDSFRALLLSERERALEQSGIGFSKSERLLLSGISREKLSVGIEEFSMPGISRESLPSWKEAASIVLLVMTVITGAACHGPQDTPTRGIAPDPRPNVCLEGAELRIEDFSTGWVDDDTYRMKEEGRAPESEMDIAKRREKAQGAAVLVAQYRLMEKIIGARLEAGGIMADEYYEEKSGRMTRMKEELKTLFKQGSVLAARWDENQRCTIIYQIRKPGLKKWVEAGY